MQVKKRFMWLELENCKRQIKTWGVAKKKEYFENKLGIELFLD
jgi:hypothetical protein